MPQDFDLANHYLLVVKPECADGGRGRRVEGELAGVKDRARRDRKLAHAIPVRATEAPSADAVR